MKWHHGVRCIANEQHVSLIVPTIAAHGGQNPHRVVYKRLDQVGEQRSGIREMCFKK